MVIGLIGLGKMGRMLFSQMREKNHKVHAHDINAAVSDEVVAEGGCFYDSLEKLVQSLELPRALWLMLPAGTITEAVFQKLLILLDQEDVLMDGGNAHYKDSVRRAEEAAIAGIHYLDVGTSGGVEGARNGACMMIGGKKEVFFRMETLFRDLTVPSGYLYTGTAGSGHYLKMVHNGIEYGMMQAIGEGFNLLHHSPYDFELEQVAKVFNHGSVVRSWLMELTEKLLREDPGQEALAGVIPSSGEGKWTLEEALHLQVPIPVIAQSLMVRYASGDEEKYGEKIVASLRNAFGGHEVHKKDVK